MVIPYIPYINHGSLLDFFDAHGRPHHGRPKGPLDPTRLLDQVSGARIFRASVHRMSPGSTYLGKIIVLPIYIYIICICIYITYIYIYLSIYILNYVYIYIYIPMVFPWYSHGIWVNDIKSLLGMNYMYYIKVNLNRMNGNIFF